jgi:alcohol dehydrogenase (cytochrome c)
MIKRKLSYMIVAGALIGMGAGPVAARVTDQDVLNDATTPGDVVTNGLGTKNQRYSPSAKITPANIKDLVPAWTFQMGDEKQRGQQSQPVVHNGKMFVTGSYSRVFALDSKTGKKLWAYQHKLPEGILPCCDVINRGGVLYDNLFIYGTLDGLLVALDQDTGKVVWKATVGEYAEGVSISSAPLIAKGMVITGMAGGEFGVVGNVSAWDAKTGKNVWVRPTIEGHMGTLKGQPNGITGTLNASWPGELWKQGSSTPWMGCAYDPETNLAYCGTGNPGPWNSHLRPGDNLYSASTVAIDIDTGKFAWAFQHTPNDAWDFDSMNTVMAFTNKKGQKLVAKADKNGFMYQLDAKTGKFVSGTPICNSITWAKGLDPVTGRPIETGNRPGDPVKSADGKKGSSVFTAPSFLGCNNQQQFAYSGDTGLFYIPTVEWGMDIWNEPVSYKKGAAYLGAGFTIRPLAAKDINGVVSPKNLSGDYMGALRAFDPITNKIVWEIRDPAPLWGGALVTKGNLVFWGTPYGQLKAADAKTGKEVWSYQTGSGIIAPPIAWEEGGEQYISVVSGWGGAVPLWGGEVAKLTAGITQGGSVTVFKLHKSK